MKRSQLARKRAWQPIVVTLGNGTFADFPVIMQQAVGQSGYLVVTSEGCSGASTVEVYLTNTTVAPAASTDDHVIGYWEIDVAGTDPWVAFAALNPSDGIVLDGSDYQLQFWFKGDATNAGDTLCAFVMEEPSEFEMPKHTAGAMSGGVQVFEDSD